MRAIITVIGKDKTGIIASVSGMLSKYNVNIEDISQTVLGDYFTMIMLVSLDNASIKFADLVKNAEVLGKESGVEIHVQNEEIFNAIHKI
ncbi:MAG: ACT domain-containing protein [Clostridiales bacterium]|nr:ACT domain-containing protein [Clostridiales bacterium]